MTEIEALGDGHSASRKIYSQQDLDKIILQIKNRSEKSWINYFVIWMSNFTKWICGNWCKTKKKVSNNRAQYPE